MKQQVSTSANERFSRPKRAEWPQNDGFSGCLPGNVEKKTSVQDVGHQNRQKIKRHNTNHISSTRPLLHCPRRLQNLRAAPFAPRSIRALDPRTRRPNSGQRMRACNRKLRKWNTVPVRGRFVASQRNECKRYRRRRQKISQRSSARRTK